MTTTSCTISNAQYNHKFPKTFLAVACFSICFALVIQLNLHSLMRHSSEAEAVHQACKQNPIGYWEADTKSYLLCQLPDGSFGIQVLVDKMNGIKGEVTSFIRKSSGKPVMDIQKVINYLEKACNARAAPMP